MLLSAQLHVLSEEVKTALSLSCLVTADRPPRLSAIRCFAAPTLWLQKEEGGGDWGQGGAWKASRAGCESGLSG